MSETTRAKRGSLQYGLMAQCFICVPVAKNDLRAQLAAEEAFLEATSTGDMSKVLALPGLRLARTQRPHRFGSLPKVGDTAGKGEDDGEQTDIEDAIGEGQEAAEDVEATEAEGEGDTPATGRRSRRAA